MGASRLAARHRKATGRETHATLASPGAYEDVSAVYGLREKLYDEMQLVQDRKETSRLEAELLKVVKKSTSKLLVPPPLPDLPCNFADVTEQSAATCNPLSMLTGAITNNNEPYLDGKVMAIVTSSFKRQQLMNKDCSDAISKFVATSSKLFGPFTTYVENKAKADNCIF